jgi:TetR/AcrR family transcriptional regulator, copper-responsive repressor
MDSVRSDTKPKRPPGRPRQFDPEAALDGATRLFWARGFTATSLDDLAAAMGMNRPSVYNAFGDKEAVYRRTLARFVARLKEEVGALLFDETDLATALERFYYAGLDVYFGTEPAPGCFVMCTAPVEALAHPEIRRDLQSIIDELDEVLARRFVAARVDAQFPADGDAKAAAQMAQAVLHSLALRARAGASKAALRRLARRAVAVVLAGSRAVTG